MYYLIASFSSPLPWSHELESSPNVTMNSTTYWHQSLQARALATRMHTPGPFTLAECTGDRMQTRLSPTHTRLDAHGRGCGRR